MVLPARKLASVSAMTELPLMLMSCPAAIAIVPAPRLEPIALVCALARRSVVWLELKNPLSLVVSPKP